MCRPTIWIRIRHRILRKILVLRRLLPRIAWTRRHRKHVPLTIGMFRRLRSGPATAVHCPASMQFNFNVRAVALSSEI
jgi:hypothetical protein